MKNRYLFVYIFFLTCMSYTNSSAEDDIEIQESDQRYVEELSVLGSHAGIESEVHQMHVPVDVYTSVDFERSGEMDLGAALTRLAPSFNYSRLSVGDGALLTAATLRGLSPDQTLVLMNGKRRHMMAWTRVLDGVIGYGTGGTDMRAIPIAAISRVEVLKDGAAAQYGSDAIAGVINYSLKKREDSNISLYSGSALDANGTTLGMSISHGTELGFDGYLYMTAEVYDTQAVERNGGNGGLDPNFQDELVMLSSPRHNGYSLFLNAGLPLEQAGELYAFGGFSRREGESSGGYRFSYNYWEGLQSGDETWDFVIPKFINFHERNNHPVYPNGFLPKEQSRINDFSIVGGWRAPVGGWDIDLSATYGNSRFNFGVANSINASIGAEWLQRNPGASIAAIIANAGPRSGDSGAIEFGQAILNLDVRRSFEHGLINRLATGFEHRFETYGQQAGEEASWSCGLPHADNYGAFAVGPDGQPLDGVIAACGFQGYPGYSPTNEMLSEGDRNSQAVYVDIHTSLNDTISVGAAMRAEHYSDAGGQTTGKLSTRLQVTPQIALRASVSTGFRAPSLSQRRFNSILFVGSKTGLTTVFAANEGHPISQAFGIDSLSHETSNNWSAGILGRSERENIGLSVDFYSIEINNRVVRSQSIDCPELPACQDFGASTAAFFFNGVDTRTQGADLSVDWSTSIFDGTLRVTVQAHINKTEIVGEHLPETAPHHGLSFDDYYGGWARELLERGQPAKQASIAGDWSRGNVGAVLRINQFGDSVQHPLDTGRIKVDASNTLGMEGWFDYRDSTLTLGVNNVLNELPTELPKTHLSNILWGIRYPLDSPIGHAGRYIYLRLNWRFSFN